MTRSHVCCGVVSSLLCLKELTGGLCPSSSQREGEGFARMARGHQKLQSQQKNAKRQAEMKKAKGHDQKTAAKAALVFTCSVCKSQMPDPKTFKQHFESKHPKSPLPPELEGVEA